MALLIKKPKAKIKEEVEEIKKNEIVEDVETTEEPKKVKVTKKVKVAAPKEEIVEEKVKEPKKVKVAKKAVFTPAEDSIDSEVSTKVKDKVTKKSNHKKEDTNKDKQIQKSTITTETDSGEAITEIKVDKRKKEFKNNSGKMRLVPESNRSEIFEIKEGGQTTQEAFVDRFLKKLIAIGYTEVTKDQAFKIKNAYSETLNEVTSVSSYQDTIAKIFYARRFIRTRITKPPKAEGGLETLMLGHFELKVRKLLCNEDDIKFFGTKIDANTFKTVDGQIIKNIDLNAKYRTVEELEKANRLALGIEDVEQAKKPLSIIPKEEDDVTEEIIESFDEEDDIEDDDVVDKLFDDEDEEE